MFTNAELNVFKKTIVRELSNSPQWQVYAPGGYWICPYCGQAGAHKAGAKEMLNEVMGHFAYKCPSWNKFQQPPMSMAAIEHHAELFHLSRRMAKEGNWDVRDADGRWYCPACGQRQGFKIPPGAKPSKKILELIIDHLRTCEPHVMAEPLLTHDELDVAVRLCTDPAMRFYDREGYWYCPFSLKRCEFKLDASRIVKREQILATAKHLRATFEYRERHGEPYDVEYVKEVVQRANRRAKVFDALKDAVKSDPVWRVRGPNGQWKCPFCRDEIAGVDISSPFMLYETAPYQMASHLVDKCAAYRRGYRPAQTVDELLTEQGPAPSSSMVLEKSNYKAAAAVYSSVRDGHDSNTGAPIDRVMDARAQSADEETGHKVELIQEATLQKAREVQMGMLPKAPDVPGYDIHVIYKPCDHVGGDFYDFIPINEHEVGIVVGDVSGHGMDAALVMVSAKKSLKIYGRTTSSPREALVILNDDIRPELPQATFITLWYGILNTYTRKLSYARAGHNPLIIYNPLRPEKLLSLEPSGMILGMAQSSIFEKTLKEEEIDLLPGDMIFQYTDGLTEMMDPEREEYGMERLQECFHRFGHELPETFLSMLEADVTTFRRGCPVDDDLTMLAVKVVS